MKLRRIPTPLLALCLLVPPTLAEVPEPGSVLLFPVQHSGPGVFTLISVTNTDTRPSNPNDFGGSTRVHYQYVDVRANPNDPFQPLGCTVNNSATLLTPADTLTVDVTCHDAGATAGAVSGGYLVVNAQSPVGPAWSHNHLVGSSVVVYASGVQYSLDAIPFSAMAPAGEFTDANSNGLLDFDGVEFEAIPDLLFLDSFVSRGNSNLALVSLTGRSTDIHSVGLSIWNDNEFPLSVSFEFRCWFDQPLNTISSVFTQSFLANGTPDDPDELDIGCIGTGRYETGWVRIQSHGVRTSGGLPVAADGALIGALTSGRTSVFEMGRPLWGSSERQTNGVAVLP